MRLSLTLVCFAGSLSLLPAATIRFATPTDYQINDYPTEIAVADFNGDGNLDLAVVLGEAATISILPGSPAGTFGPIQTITQNSFIYLPTVITAGDLNSDSIPDVVVAGSHNFGGGSPYGIQSFLFQKDGTVSAQRLASFSDTLQNMTVAELTGDHVPDLIATEPGGVHVFPGTGDGNFTNGPITAIPGAQPVGLVLRDFNGDGRLDVAVSDSAGDRFWVLLGNGDGTFQTPLAIPVAQKTQAIASADLNNDGFPDIVVAGVSQLFSLLGRGDGTFGPPVGTTAGKIILSVVLADFNCDGILDAATANYNGPGVTVLQGVGDGTFTAPRTIAPGGSEPEWVVAGDFDHDGRPDIAVAKFASSVVSVYLNRTLVRPTNCRVSG